MDSNPGGEAAEVPSWDGRLLLRLGEALLPAAGPGDFLDGACRILVEEALCGLAWAAALPDAPDEAPQPLAQGGRPATFLSFPELSPPAEPASPAAQTLARGDLRLVPDIAAAAGPEPWRERALAAGLEAGAALPLAPGGSLWGVLCLYGPPSQFSPTSRDALAALAAHLSLYLELALANAGLRQEKDRLAEEKESLTYYLGRERDLRQATEDSLEQSEARCTTLYQALPLPTFTWRVEESDFRLVDYNSAAWDLTAGRVAAHLGKTAQEMAEGQPDLPAILGATARGRKLVPWETTLQIDPQGSPRHLTVRCGLVPPDLLVMHAEDITHQKEIEEHLRQSEMLFRTVSDYTYDWESWSGVDGALLYVSPSFERITGYTVAELMADPGLLERITHPDDRELVTRHRCGSCEKPKVVQLDFRILTRDNQVRWINHLCQPVYGEDGAWQGRRASQRDVTQRKKLENSLRSTSERYSALIQGLPVGVMSLDAAFRITEWNQAARTMTGFEAQEILGRPCYEVMVCHQGGRRCPLREALHTGHAVGPLERLIPSRSGGLLPVRMRAAVLTDRRGQFVAGVETFHDISELKSLERQQDNLLSMLAHDMKSPLVSLQGFARLLLEKNASLPGEKREAYLEVIFKQSGRLAELIGDFLEYSRHRTTRLDLHPAPCDLAAELRELVEAFGPRFAWAGVKLELAGGELPTNLPADAARLRRVFTNLLENALKHAPPHTSVLISLEQSPREVIVVVRDQGPGFAPGELSLVFEPLFRGRGGGHYQGHGLGLAAVKAIVEGHGGTVIAGNDPTGGAVLTIHLPRPRG
ncbi:MAG: PAS domain-containing sensor histidine kinase [Deltaproteobacteria bacterium]|nr:PAS domain-containing sensor histidine kinase [Deltaproteobacteria bacterium]MCB2186339.1 PAS domain-containing sensor histidine kinase [Deltaproteobacteria bacterium]